MQKPHFNKEDFTAAALKEKIASIRYDKAFQKKAIFVLVELLVLALIITFDLCMKDYLYNLLKGTKSGSMTFIEGFMDLTYSVNTGAGFGMFKDSTTALTVITAVVVSLVLLYLALFHTDSEWLRMPLVFIVGGGIGNLVDRVSLGYVRDFFEFTFVDFAIFNVADAFVTVGSIWLIIYLVVLVFKEGANVKKQAAAKADGTSLKTEGFSANEDGSEDGDYKLFAQNGEGNENQSSFDEDAFQDLSEFIVDDRDTEEDDTEDVDSDFEDDSSDFLSDDLSSEDNVDADDDGTQL